MGVEVSVEALARFFGEVLPHLNERQTSAVVGAAAGLVGNKSMVAEASGVSRNTVIKGLYAADAGWRPRILRVGTVAHVIPQPRSSRRR